MLGKLRDYLTTRLIMFSGDPTLTRPGQFTVKSNGKAYVYYSGAEQELGASGGSGAPTNAQYLTLALDGTLTAERRFVPTLPLSAADGGANGDYTLSLSGWSGTTDGDMLYRNGSAVGSKTPAQARTWLDLASLYQPLDADLTAYAALSSTGLVARTGAGTVATRTLTAPAAGVTVSNGDGVSGNPTLALANDLAALEALSSTGIAVRTAADTWAQRTIEVGAGLTAANGDGVAGNPSITLDDMIKSVRAFNYFTIILPQGPTTPNVDGMGLLTAAGIWNSNVSEANFPAFQVGDGGSALCRWYVLAYYRTNAGTYSITFWWKMTADIGSVGVVTVFMGLSSVVSLNSADPTGHRVCLRYVSGTDTNWQLSTKDGATQSLADTGVAVTASYYYAAQLTITSSSASVKIGRDTTAAAAITAMIADTPITASGNFPTSTTDLYLIQSINRSTIGTARGLISGGAWQSLTP